MGSSGTGKLTDYSSRGGQTGSGGQGGSSGSDQCENAITEQLEEVATTAYFTKKKTVPPSGTPIRLSFNKRLVVSDSSDTEIGFLPTQFNYLVSCLGNGFRYEGTVVHSTDSPLPSVLVTLTAYK